MLPNKLKSERGVATLIAVLMMGMLLLIGLAAMSTSDDEVQIAGNEMQEMRAFYAAEAGLEKAAAELQIEYDSTGRPPQMMPQSSFTVNDCEVTYYTDGDGTAEQRVLTNGSLAGLHALVSTYAISATSEADVDGAAMTLIQTFETALIPIFQFAVFYENDLWATPADDMTITGRVHVNGDMYLQANTNMYFDGRVTSAGGIYHGFPGGLYSGTNGGVWFKDDKGVYQNMYEDGYWLDADHSDWYNRASDRWGGMVRDADFGESSLNLPLTNGGTDAHSIIDRGDGNSDSYEHKATLVIKDGQALRKASDGSWSDVTANMISDGALTFAANKFYDAREKEWVDCIELDMSKMYDMGYAPSNGVIYVSDNSAGYPGVRLVNGSELDAPLSVFSENPLYVRGNYNTVDKKPAAVIADVVTYLSNNWNDANSSGLLSSRTTTPTTVNASMITGDLDPDIQTYSGGLANLPRFLENWNGTKFTLCGSMVDLWRTKQADGTWSYGGSTAYYTAPTRDYRFDKDLEDPNKLPPETPVVRSFRRVGWRQEFAGN